MVSKHDEKAHLDDYNNILKRLKEEKNNHIPEPYTRTLDQIEYHIRFFENKIRSIT